MQIVIDIPEETYKSIKHGMRFKDDVEAIMTQIENGTPLPKGHGRLIDVRDIGRIPTIIEADKEGAEE